MGNGSKSKSSPNTTIDKKSSSTKHTGSSHTETRESIKKARKKLLWSCCYCKKSAGMSYRMNEKCTEFECQHLACDYCYWEKPGRSKNVQDYEQSQTHDYSAQHTQATTSYQTQQTYQATLDESQQPYNQDDQGVCYYEDSQPGPSGHNNYHY